MRMAIAWVFLFLSAGTFAQRPKYIRYNQLISTAGSLARSGDHTRAEVVYDSAFALIPWVALDHVPAVLNALAAGDSAHTNELLLEAVEGGLRVNEFYAPELLAYLNTAAAKPFLDDWGYMEQRFLAHADTAAIAELERIGTGRTIEHGPGGEFVVHKDSTAIDRFVELVALRGFPTALTVGPISNNVRRLLADQAPDYPDGHYWRILLPYINKEITRGALEPEFLCLFQDIADHDQGRPLTFGEGMHRFLDEPHVVLAAHARIGPARAALGLKPIDAAIEELETYPSKFVFAEDDRRSVRSWP